MDQINYYKVLQVDQEAETEVVKAAYRALSRKYHPDGTHPSAERMMRLNDAYAVLNDPPARARHNDEIERWDFTAGRTRVRPSTMPRMRYQDDGSEPPPKPRRRYRPYRASVMVQIMIVAVCILALLSTGILKPASSTPPPSPTPPPPVYQTDAQALKMAYETDGFVFNREYTRAGEPLTWGVDDANATAVYIDEYGGSIRFASLLLAAREELDLADHAEEDRALGLLLDASFGPSMDRDLARQWINGRLTIPEADDSVVISGWSIRVWPASEEQTGIAIRPVVQ